MIETKRLKILLMAVAFCLVMALPVIAQQTTNTPKTEQTQTPDNEEDLRRAIETSAGSPTEFMKNLEAYLQKYPQSARRAEIERELYKTAVEQRDRNRTMHMANG